MYRLIHVRYACSVRRLRCRRRATSITLSRSFGSGMMTDYIGHCGLMIGSDTYLIVMLLSFTTKRLFAFAFFIGAVCGSACGLAYLDVKLSGPVTLNETWLEL